MAQVELVEGRTLLDLFQNPSPWMAPVSGTAASQLANVAAIELRRAAETTRPEPPIASGKGLQSIRARQVGPSRAVVLMQARMQFVNDGRRAGGRMPPPRALEPWLRRRQRQGRLRGVTPFQLARSIQQRGVRPRRFVERGLRNLPSARVEVEPLLAEGVRREWRVRGA